MIRIHQLPQWIQYRGKYLRIFPFFRSFFPAESAAASSVRIRNNGVCGTSFASLLDHLIRHLQTNLYC